MYLNDLLGIEKNYPKVYEEFLKGNFVVKASDIPFASVASDQRLEQTANREKKSVGGIIGQTNLKGYVTKWDLIHHEMLANDMLFYELTFVDEETYELQTHKDFSLFKIEDSEKMIKKLNNLLAGRKTPSNAQNQPLRNLFTQEIVGTKTSESILNIFQIGCDVFETFRLERYEKKFKSLSVPIKGINMPSFETVEKKKNEKPITNEKDDQMVQRLIDLARLRGFSVRKLFHYELMKKNVLHDDKGFLKKENNKSLLRREYEKKYLRPDDFELPDIGDICVVIDVMVICRSLKLKHSKYFKNYGERFCETVKHKIESWTSRIDFAFDSYFENSPKNHERPMRRTADPIDLFSITEEDDIPQNEGSFWDLTNNKTLLQSFLRSFIFEHKEKYWPNVEILCSATQDELCKSSNHLRENNTLSSLQNYTIEEADSRIIMHPNHAVDEGYSEIIVITSDTDVFALMVNYFYHLSSRGSKVNELMEMFSLFLKTHISEIKYIIADSMFQIWLYMNCYCMCNFFFIYRICGCR